MFASTAVPGTESERPGPITPADKVPPPALVTATVCCADRPLVPEASAIMPGETVRFCAPPLTVRVTEIYANEPSDPLTCTKPR